MPIKFARTVVFEPEGVVALTFEPGHFGKASVFVDGRKVHVRFDRQGVTRIVNVGGPDDFTTGKDAFLAEPGAKIVTDTDKV